MEVIECGLVSVAVIGCGILSLVVLWDLIEELRNGKR
jgi:hypothetical protein